jgi:hypothetical protein
MTPTSRLPSPSLGFIGCRDGLFKLPAIRTPGPVYSDTRLTGGLPSDHLGSARPCNHRDHLGSSRPFDDRHIVTHLALHRCLLARSRHPAHRHGVLGHSAVHPQPARRVRDSVTNRLASRPARTAGAPPTAAAAISSISCTARTRSRLFPAHAARGTLPSSARTSSIGPCGRSMIP